MEDVIERLASLIHDQWMSWSKTIAEEENISPERLHRWAYYWRPYEELNEESKEADRKWARKFIGAIQLPKSE